MRQGLLRSASTVLLFALFGCGQHSGNQIVASRSGTGKTSKIDALATAAHHKPESGGGEVLDSAALASADCSAAGQAPATAGLPSVRLLSKIEFSNTVSDLFGIRPADSEITWADDRTSDYSAPATGYLSATDFSALDKITEKISNQFVTTLQAPSNPARCTDPGIATTSSKCVSDFVALQGLRAFRRPLAAVEKASLNAMYVGARAKAFSHNEAMSLVIEAILQSPNFLYRTEIGESGSGSTAALGPYEFATSMAYLITKSTPDDILLAAAESGKLATDAGLQEQVERLLNSKPGSEGTVDFYLRWMGVGAFHDAKKDTTLFPEFTQAFRTRALEETANFVREHGLSKQGSFKDMLLTKGESRVVSDQVGTPRSGLFTQVTFLAGNSDFADTKPLHVGKMILDKMLCNSPPAPPASAINTPFTADPLLSKRVNFEKRTSGPACIGCHTALSPVSFAFDAYDPLGRHRTHIGNMPLDVTGEIRGSRDADGKFDDVPGMMSLLSNSEQVSECHVQHWMRYALGREVLKSDACSVEAVHQAFKASNQNIRSLLLAILKSESLRNRRK